MRLELLSFSRAYTTCAGREGFKGRCTLFKNVDYDALRFFESKRSENQHLGLREGVTKKTIVYQGSNLTFLTTCPEGQ